MKKIFLSLAVVAVLALVASPSYALKGIDDPVPGVDFLVPFVVEIGSGVDTSIIIQNISNNAALYGPVGGVANRGDYHWRVFTVNSAHIGDQHVRLSRNDVESVSMRLLLTTWFGASIPALEQDWDGDGTADHWVGYITFTNETAATAAVPNPRLLEDHVAYFEYVDLNNGQASGIYAPMREACTAGQGFDPLQRNVRTGNGAGAVAASNVEVFTPDAYAASWLLEANQAAAGATNIQFYPRWYLHNAGGETYIIIWKSKTDITAAGSTTAISWVDIVIYDNEETPFSSRIWLPSELNIIRASSIVPPAFVPSYPSGGWVDITIDGINSGIQGWDDTEWLCWVWQTADSASASLNWSALWNDRKVGTN